MGSLTEVIGEYERYQYFVFTFVLLTGFIAPIHHFVTLFIAPPMSYWCAQPNDLKNLSKQEWLYISNQTKALEKNSKSCLYLESESLNRSFASNSTQSFSHCSNFEFDKENIDYSITEKWKLVCEDEFYISLSSSIYFIGMMVGVIIMGQISDRAGRKRTLLAGLILWFCTSIGTVISENFIFFMILRFFVGLFHEGGFVAEWVLFMEVCSSKQRVILGNLSSLGFGLGFSALAVTAYYIRNWQYILLVTTLPLIFIFIYACFLFESPLWLISQNEFDESKDVICKIAKFNKRKVNKEVLNRVSNTQKDELKNELNKSFSILDLFKTPNMRKKTCVIYFLWLVDSFVYYGLSVNTGDLDGNYYLNFALSGLVELPAYILSIFVLLKFGKRIPLFVVFFIGGVSLLLMIVIPSGLPWLRVTLAMIGKFGIAASFQITYVYSSELFPTVVRNIGVGSSSMFSRLGSIVSPFINDLSKKHGNYIPSLLFGSLSIIAGILVLYLPETKDMVLPETIQDGENFIRGSELKNDNNVNNSNDSTKL